MRNGGGGDRQEAGTALNVNSCGDRQLQMASPDCLSQINRASHLSSHHPSVVGEMQALNMQAVAKAFKEQQPPDSSGRAITTKTNSADTLTH